MSAIIDTNGIHPGYPTLGEPAAHAKKTSESPSARSFEIELRLRENPVELSTFRQARIHAVRAEIEAGTFETPERMRGTVERLLDVIA